jgi:hypothetical protein
MRWTSAVKATPLYGMDPAEVAMANATSRQEFLSNVEGCRNALTRTLATMEVTDVSTNDSKASFNNNIREASTSNWLPPSSDWEFAGRVLHMEKRQCRIHTATSIDDTTRDFSTMEYVFVCYLDSKLPSNVDHGQLRMNMDGNTFDLSANQIPVTVSAIDDTVPLVNGETQHSTHKNCKSKVQWISRSQLVTGLTNQQQMDLHLDKKFVAVATKLLALANNINAKSPLKHDFWVKPSLPISLYPEEIVAAADDVLSTPVETEVLLGDEG